MWPCFGEEAQVYNTSFPRSFNYSLQQLPFKLYLRLGSFDAALGE